MAQKATLVQIAASLACAMLSTIREVGSDGIPAGHLYAAMMNAVDLETFELLLEALISTSLIEVDGFHVIRAVPQTKN